MTVVTQGIERARHIINKLEDATYARDFQVAYEDVDLLEGELGTIVDTIEPVTTPRQIDHLSQAMAQIAAGDGLRHVIITGNCSERIVDPASAIVPSQEALTELGLVRGSELSSVLHIRRDRGQNTKPRSEEFEYVDGEQVTSYMGDAINAPDSTLRSPDPRRLTLAAQQAMMLERRTSRLSGAHIPSAHEALSLHYENAFLQDTNEGRYLLSADMPWIGVRTNGVDSRHVELLSAVENPVGVKIGSDSTFDHLRDLTGALNPARRLGKLAWMLRIGLNNEDAMHRIVGSLVEIEESPIILYDIHGSTVKRGDGVKIRAVEAIKAEIEQLYEVCGQEGAQLRGLHLETTVKNRLECVATVNDTPTHEGGIDPQLNSDQTREVLNHFARVAS